MPKHTAFALTHYQLASYQLLARARVLLCITFINVFFMVFCFEHYNMFTSPQYRQTTHNMQKMYQNNSDSKIQKINFVSFYFYFPGKPLVAVPQVSIAFISPLNSSSVSLVMIKILLMRRLQNVIYGSFDNTVSLWQEQ